MLCALVCFTDNTTEIIAGVSCGLGFLAILLVTNLVRYFSVFVMNPTAYSKVVASFLFCVIHVKRGIGGQSS